MLISSKVFKMNNIFDGERNVEIIINLLSQFIIIFCFSQYLVLFTLYLFTNRARVGLRACSL